MPRIEITGLKEALAQIAKRPLEENQEDWKGAYEMVMNMIGDLKDNEEADPDMLDELLADKMVATKMVLFYVHAPVEKQKDVDAHAKAFDAFFRAVGRRGEDSFLRAYLMQRTNVVYKAVMDRSEDQSRPMLRLCSAKKDKIDFELKHYCKRLDKGHVPDNCPPDAIMLTWMGYTTRMQVLQQCHGLFAAVSRQWTDELVQEMTNHDWFHSGRGGEEPYGPLRILEIGSGKTPWVAKSLLESARDATEEMQVTCTDSGEARPDVVHRFDDVPVFLEKSLDAVRARGSDADVLLMSWPCGYWEEFRLLESLYEFSVRRARPARVIYVGEPYSERHINISAFSGWKEMFHPEFELTTYRSWPGFRDNVYGGYFVPRCQNTECRKATVELRKCTRCYMRWYCSKECQAEDWKREDRPDAAHRKFCTKTKLKPGSSSTKIHHLSEATS